MTKFITALLIFFMFHSISAEEIAEKVKSAENRGMLYATLWQQHSAEFRALCYQAYNIAELRLNEILKDRPQGNLAIVVDADETIIDNSPYEAMLIVENQKYPYKRDKWINDANCKAIPGSIEFLNYAVKNGVDIFYISNRSTSQLKGTMENLRKLGFPQIEDSHFLFKSKGVNKEDRRKKVEETHNIILLAGDNLNDFDIVFKRKSIQERFVLTDKFKEDFGKKFIVLPNAMYGEWLKALYHHERISTDEKNKIYRESLEYYK